MGGNKILLVDDSRFARARVAEVLVERGYQLELASNGLEALECLNKVSCSLVLCDLEMPEMGGLDFVRELRRREHHNGVKVVMLTGSSSSDEMQEARRAGADGWLMKPVESKLLLSKVKRFFGPPA